MLKYRFYFLILFSFFLPFSGLSQKPVIVKVEPKSSSMGREVIIYGTGFDTDLNNLVVHFGAANATILEARENLLSVRVPSGTVYRSISVTNLVSRLTGYSDDPYLLSYSGTAFDESLFDTPIDLASENELYDLILEDFDGDGKIDIVTANNNSNLINVFKNTSAVGAVSFSKQFITISSSTINVNTRDLNGDGKPEIVISKSGNPGDRVYYMKNTSVPGTISFSAPQFLFVDGNIARRIEIEDLDKDGLPEIIVANQSTNKISIHKNTSSGGNISFAPLETVSLIDPDGATLHSAGLVVCDLNGDGFPEIVSTRFLEKDVYITPNESQIGSLNLGATLRLNITGNISFIAAGDVNQDGKNDLLISKLQQNQVAVLLNNGTDASISFDSEQLFTVNNRPWGISLGDLNGDGLTDLAVASIDQTNKRLTVLENTSSSPGGFSLSSSYINTPEITRNLKVGDIDNDGKPDLVMTNSLGATSNVTILRNKNCLVPKMEPNETQDLCVSASVTLTATPSNGATYTWKRSDNTSLGTGTDPFFTFTAAVGSFDYYVEVSSEGGSCVTSSNATTINVSSGIIPNPPTILDPPPVCEGGDITLQINPATIIGGAVYTWQHPDGSTTDGQSLTLSNVTIADAGRYILLAFDGGCESSEDDAFLEVIVTPLIAIVSDDNLVFCDGQTASLRVTNDPSYSYKWFRNGNVISGAINATYTATLSGDYTTEVTTTGGCTIVSEPTTTIAAVHPAASFNAPSTACVAKTVTFTNTSTVQGGINVFYFWDFGDGATSTNENPTYTFASSSTYSVSLTVSYDDASCANTSNATITISDPPTISIDADITEFCPGGSANLSIAGTFASILWSTGEDTNNITVTAGATYSVTVTTTANCESTSTIDITEFNLPVVQVDPADPIIEEGGSIQLLASGAVTYLWSPSTGLDDVTIDNPVASPIETTTYSVTGTSTDQCEGITEVTVTVNEPVSELVPQLMFSPNGDGINDLWVIENIEDCRDCTLSIYDRSGVKIFEEVNYSQSWDGIFNGSNLESDVYYFLVTDGSKKVKSGSITLVK